MELTQEENRQVERARYIKGLGLTYQATFQPTPQPNEKSPKLHWLITLSKGNTTMQVPYSEGYGHVKGYKQFHKTKWDKRSHDEGIRFTCETGKLYIYMTNIDRWMPTTKTQPAPTLENVLWCLIMDSDCLNYSNYEEWAAEFDYDEDSRKGDATYRLCLEQSLKLKQLIGNQAIEDLIDLYQDY